MHVHIRKQNEMEWLIRHADSQKQTTALLGEQRQKGNYIESHHDVRTFNSWCESEQSLWGIDRLQQWRIIVAASDTSHNPNKLILTEDNHTHTQTNTCIHTLTHRSMVTPIDEKHRSTMKRRRTKAINANGRQYNQCLKKREHEKEHRGASDSHGNVRWEQRFTRSRCLQTIYDAIQTNRHTHIQTYTHEGR